MNHFNQASEDAWERILPQIRVTRRKRHHRKIATIATFCAILGIWIGMRFSLPAPRPESAPVAQSMPEASTSSTLAVMRVYHDGTVRLEEIASHELGPIELTLSLSPVIVSAFVE